MTASGSGKLYTSKILALATELANYPLDPLAQFNAQVRSRSCGSSLELSLSMDGANQIFAIGFNVTACAMGQAAAAIFAAAATGQNGADAQRYHGTIQNWLSADGPIPDWPRLELLDAARNYPGRHEAILLPWRAASEALCNTQTSG
ncbi:hypothetical protein GCM10023115_17560 [Pontixanthobacter gangjinensis]|uniref:Iron-sulfur cluster assembly scaffold protein n=1 Tax=Pontixanthobacter gangjinensis TaxID=1028742 RepID=A0A6I4SM72_9SPHN|nr:iron-sulfur cluster assembly scaffold protein [Pontixanthobacter gangjinensis]